MAEKKIKVDNEYVIVLRMTIAIVFGFLATVSVNLWLTWRMCRVIEAILAD